MSSFKNVLFPNDLFFQIIKFQEARKDELSSAAREVKQAVEKGELNIRWMGKNYRDVFDWLKQQNAKRRF